MKINILDKASLKKIFIEIEGTENRARRQKAYKELDIFNQNQEKYINEKISQIYGEDACKNIQTITSINLATRIVNSEASIYKKEPERSFANAKSENFEEDIEYYYESMCANEKLKLANKLYKLGSQCTMMVIPDYPNKCLKIRLLYKHQYDVVPMDTEPDSAFSYIIPLEAPKDAGPGLNESFNRGDQINQTIADKNDKDMSKYKYIVWTDEYNFMANGNGDILDQETGNIIVAPETEKIANPIGKLPFIDIASEKFFGFWVDNGSSLTDFTVTFGCILSDMGEIVKLQGYSQPVISSVEEPKTINVGPHRVLWLKKDKTLEGDMNPTFEFATPTPDIAGSLSFIENVLRMFLTSRGTDSNLITSKETKDFSSGFERLLSMIDRSEATVDDKIVFKRVEQQFFSLVKSWHNYLLENQPDQLDEDLKKIKQISDDVSFSVKFAEPMQIETKTEKEDSAIKRLDAGLATKLMAIMEIYSVDEDKAKEMLAEIQTEAKENAVNNPPPDKGADGKVVEDTEDDDTTNA